MEYINTVVTFIALNLIFVVCCLPIITIGPAIAAMYQVTLREVRGEHSYIIKKFFQHFKEMFVQGIVTFLSFGVVSFALVYSLTFWNVLDGTLAIAATVLSYVFLAVILAGFLYVFPLMARFENTIKQTIKNAFLIALTNTKATLLLLLIQVFAVSLLYQFPVFRVILLLIGFSFLAYCNSYILTKVFKQYEPETESL